MYACKNVSLWPFLPVNEGLNGAESDFRFVLESGRSECTCWDRALRLLMAESGPKPDHKPEFRC